MCDMWRPGVLRENCSLVSMTTSCVCEDWRLLPKGEKSIFVSTCAENGNKRWSGRHEWACVVAVDKQLQRIALLSEVPSLGRCSNWREDLEGGQGSIPRQSQRAGQGAENTRTLSHISQGEENTQSHQSGHDEDKSEQVRADTQSHQSGHDEDKLHIILQ